MYFRTPVGEVPSGKCFGSRLATVLCLRFGLLDHFPPRRTADRVRRRIARRQGDPRRRDATRGPLVDG